MPIVHFSATQARHTGGLRQLAVDAPRVHELLVTLTARYPGLSHELDDLAVAIDGEIHPDGEYETLAPLTEIYFVPRIAGG